MIDYRSAIDDIVNQTKTILASTVIGSSIVADSKDVYAIQLKLKNDPVTYVPEKLAFSFDQETGFYIDIDGVTWEFVKDVNVFMTTAIELLNAIKEKRVKLVEKKAFGLILLRKELIIE